MDFTPETICAKITCAKESKPEVPDSRYISAQGKPEVLVLVRKEIGVGCVSDALIICASGNTTYFSAQTFGR